MLVRDIYRDLYDEPDSTIEAKLVLAGKRLGAVLAGVALILGASDLAGFHSVSAIGNFAQPAPSKAVAPREVAQRKPTVVVTHTATETVRVAIPATADKAESPKPSPIDRLAVTGGKDAIALAMSAPKLAAPAALTGLPAPAVVQVAAPVMTEPVLVVPPAAAAAQASVPPVAEIQLASLPSPAATPDQQNEPAAAPSAPTDLAAAVPIPLGEVPLPRPAPPLSPAERLNLKDKEYARAEKCLANAIYFEARSESIRGQMAVAQVVVNRAFSGFYPSDICGVVYQNANRHLACQFTFACDGKRKVITERGHWAVANRIARQTLNGQIYVPEVGKSTHYHAAYVHPNWVREMKKLVRFGVHSFYRPYAWGNGQEEPVWGSAAGPTRVHKTALR